MPYRPKRRLQCNLRLLLDGMPGGPSVRLCGVHDRYPRAVHHIDVHALMRILHHYRPPGSYRRHYDVAWRKRDAECCRRPLVGAVFHEVLVVNFTNHSNALP